MPQKLLLTADPIVTCKLGKQYTLCTHYVHNMYIIYSAHSAGGQQPFFLSDTVLADRLYTFKVGKSNMEQMQNGYRRYINSLSTNVQPDEVEVDQKSTSSHDSHSFCGTIDSRWGLFVTAKFSTNQDK